MNRLSLLGAGLPLLLVACADAGPEAFGPNLNPAAGGVASVVEVTTSADVGAGSLRAALAEAAVEEGVRRIRVAPHLGTVHLASPLVFEGPQALALDANGLVLDGSALPPADPALSAALVVNGGGNLVVSDLAVEGSTGSGILVSVPAGRTGTLTVELTGVSVSGSAQHGIFVNDQPGYFADPFTRDAGGSDASLHVRVRNAQIRDNGFGGLDYDGIRINEGGIGSLDAIVAQSVVEGNGADGIELDERGTGDAVFSLEHTRLLANGFFTSEDYDDGIDVDELGAGNLIGAFISVVANGNAEQGVDLNENNEGDLRVTMVDVTAESNASEGIEFEEDDDFEDFPEETWGGDLDAALTGVSTSGNGFLDADAGLKLREKFAGNLTARITNASSTDNAVSGIQVREGQGGSMEAEIVRPTVTGNAGAGIDLRGNGAVRIEALTGGANVDGDIEAEAGIVLE
jgi:hypothetical protein